MNNDDRTKADAKADWERKLAEGYVPMNDGSMNVLVKPDEAVSMYLKKQYTTDFVPMRDQAMKLHLVAPDKVAEKNKKEGYVLDPRAAGDERLEFATEPEQVAAVEAEAEPDPAPSSASEALPEPDPGPADDFGDPELS